MTESARSTKDWFDHFEAIRNRSDGDFESHINELDVHAVPKLRFSVTLAELPQTWVSGLVDHDDSLSDVEMVLLDHEEPGVHQVPVEPGTAVYEAMEIWLRAARTKPSDDEDRDS